MEVNLSNKRRDPSIQLIRVIACMMVFTVHFGQRVDLSGTIRDFTDFGSLGVELFFLISGFLAGKTFFSNPDLNIKEYYLKRAIAILPLYFFVVIYYFITENIINQFVSCIPLDESGIGWFRYLFLLNGFFNSDTYFWSNLGITWTIPIFMFFYLIAPWILRKTNGVFSSVVVWGIVFVTTKLLGHFYPCSISNNLHLLFLGVILYFCSIKQMHKPAILIFQMATIFSIILEKHSFTYIFVFASIILILNKMNDNFTLPIKLQKIIDVLDSYSYTLYLMHGVVFCSLLDRLNTLGISKVLIGIIAIIGTFFATWIVGKYIEKPTQNLLRKKLLKN